MLVDSEDGVGTTVLRLAEKVDQNPDAIQRKHNLQHGTFDLQFFFQFMLRCPVTVPSRYRSAIIRGTRRVPKEVAQR